MGDFTGRTTFQTHTHTPSAQNYAPRPRNHQKLETGCGSAHLHAILTNNSLFSHGLLGLVEVEQRVTIARWNFALPDVDVLLYQERTQTRKIECYKHACS